MKNVTPCIDRKTNIRYKCDVTHVANAPIVITHFVDIPV